jgi:hypothetical protein
MASTQHFQGAELGGGVVGGDWIQRRHGRARRCRRRAMTGGAHLSARRGEAGRFPTMEVETRWGTGVARGPAGSG